MIEFDIKSYMECECTRCGRQWLGTFHNSESLCGPCWGDDISEEDESDEELDEFGIPYL